MYRHKVQIKHKKTTKNTNLIKRLDEAEMDLKRLRLEGSCLEDKILYSNRLIEEKIRSLEHQLDKEPF
jgi:hypothetical protein